MPNVKFRFIGDDSELRKKLANLAKMQADISNNFRSNLSKGGTNAVSEAIKQVGKDAIAAAKEAEVLNRTANNSAIRDAKLADIAAIKKLRDERSKEISELNFLKQVEQEHKGILADKKSVTESLIQEEKQLSVEYKKGQLSLQEYNKSLKEAAEARRKANDEERKAEKVLRDSEKARKDGDREEAKRQKDLDRRKKLLEQESSEYFKLNKALGAVRKEAKEVLAEMFRMERQGHKNTAGYEALRKKSEGLVAQTQLLDRGIKKIDATLGIHYRNVGNYGEALELISPQIANINQHLQVFGTSLDDLATKPGAIKEVGAAFLSIGKGILGFVLSPIGLFITALGALFMLFKGNKQTVIDFNNGLLNVGKTTGLEGKALQDLADDIVGLSRALKTVSTDKLLEYATVAGQLGVKGSQNILAFTEALAKLETASDIKGEEGGSEIARLLTLTDGGVQNIKAFGDEIVNLGNNFAATENEILSNATKIAQSTGVYKVGRQEVLAFATATKSVGVEAELVGSTMGRTLGTLEKVIRSGKGLGTVLKLVGGTQAELSKRFREDASGVLIDFIGGLNRTGKSAADFNKSLEAVGITAIRDQAVLGSLASNGFDILTDALTNVKDATGAMDAEFETASGKIVNQSARIGIAWDNMVLSIENGSGAIGVASVAVVGFFAEILEGITNVVTSNSWGEFFTRINPTNWGRGSSINRALGLKEVFDDVRKFNKEISKIGDGSNAWIRTEFSKMNKHEFEKAYKLAKEHSEKMAKASLDYETGVLSGDLKETENTVNEYKKQESIARLHLSRMEQIRSKKGYDFSGKPKVGIAGLEEESEKERLKRERAEAAAAKKAERIVENARKATERQRSLQLEIDKINETASRNQLSRDESEVESVKDKYAKIKEEVRKFYDDPKNKGKKVDTSGLLASEKFEVSEATIRQNTKRLEESFDAQKRLLDEYNSFADQTSKEEADKRFGNELSAFKDYEKNVEKAYWDLLTKKKTADIEGLNSTLKLTQAEEEQFKILEKRRDEISQNKRQKESRDLIESLQLSATTESKINDIRVEYARAYATLEKNKTSLTVEEFEKRKEALKKGQSEEIGSILLPDLQKTGDWINVFEKSSQLAVSKVKNSVSVLRTSLEKMLSDGKITVEQYNEALKQIKGVEVEVNVSEKGFGRLKQILKELKEAEKGSLKYDQARQKLGQEINYWGQGIVDAGNEALNVADKLGLGSEKFKEDMALTMNLASDAVNLASSIASGDVMGIITNGIKTLSSAISLFTKDRGIERKIQDYQRQIEVLGKSYEALQKKMNGNDTNYYANSDQLIANLKEQQRLLEQSAKAEEDKKKTDKEKVKGYKEQSEAINKQIEDTENAIRQMRLQTDINSLAQSITDALVGAFESGEDGIDAMDKAFDKFIKNSLANSVRLKFVQKIIDDMLNQVDKYMASNDNSIVGFDFTEWDKKLNQAGKEAMDFLESAYKGLGLEKDSSSSGSGLSGAIKKEITEATASELTGFARSTFDLAKRDFLESQSQGVTLSKQLDVANRKLIVLNQINTNTANTVARLDTAVKHLDQLVKNTSQQSNRAYTG